MRIAIYSYRLSVFINMRLFYSYLIFDTMFSFPKSRIRSYRGRKRLTTKNFSSIMSTVMQLRMLYTASYMY